MGAGGRSSGGGGGPQIVVIRTDDMHIVNRPGGGNDLVYVRDPRDGCYATSEGTVCYGGLDPVAPGPGGTGAGPAQPRPNMPPISPQEIVEQTIVNLPLPRPEPRIEPDEALTGLRSYLEAGTDLDHTFPAIDTVLGPLDIQAQSTYVVDWGDGTVTGPHASPGGPYPDGDVTHVYSDTAVVDVTVTQNWTAQWQLAGQSGTVSGLQTANAIEDFPVGEVQAIRQR